MIAQVELLAKYMIVTSVKSAKVIGVQEDRSLKEDNAYALFNE